jgi:hypothetical protein
MDNPYLEVISYVECLHRQFLEVVKLELEGFGIHDINNVQAMMLFNIGLIKGGPVGRSRPRGFGRGARENLAEEEREARRMGFGED